MKHRAFVFAPSMLISFAALATACGSPPPPQPPPTTPEQKPVAPVEAPVDLSAVPIPDRVVFIGQVKNPGATLKTVGGWMHFPMPGSEQVAELVLGKPVGDVLDLDKPIHGIGILIGSGKKAKPTFAAEIALHNFADAKRQFEGVYSLNKADNGDFEVMGIDESPKDDDDHKACFISHAANPANPSDTTGAALVCGFGPSIDKVLPYLVRTSVKDAPTQDVHAEFRFGPAREDIRSVISVLPAGLAAVVGSAGSPFGEMTEAAGADLSDFILDFDKIAFDANLDDKAANLELGFGFETKKATMTEIALSHADKIGPPPPAFWHLPSDTDFAVYGGGIDSKLFEHPKDLLVRAITAAAKDQKMPDAESKLLFDALAHTFSLLSAPSLFAQGYDDAAIHTAKEAGNEREAVTQAIGWHLWRFEQPIAQVGPTVKQWASTWSRPGFQKWGKDFWSVKNLPTLRVVPVAASLKLPKDTVHLEMTITVDDEPSAPKAGGHKDERAPGGKPLPPTPSPKPKAPEKPIVIHLFAVPDAGATAISMAMDADLAAKKALSSISTSPDNETIKGRQGFEAFRDLRSTDGGFVTMHAIEGLTHFGRDPSRRLGGMSNNARTPFMFAVSATPAGDPRGKEGAMTITARVPKDLVIDMAKTMMR